MERPGGCPGHGRPGEAAAPSRAARRAGLALCLGPAAACLPPRGGRQEAFSAGAGSPAPRSQGGVQGAGAPPPLRRAPAANAAPPGAAAAERRRADGGGLALALASLCGAGAVALGRAERKAASRRRGSAAARPAEAGLATAERPDFARSRKKDKEGGEEGDLDWSEVSEDWEVDCFSRPIVRDGKKIWELMVTDANGMYRRVAQMKPTRVNSVVVQKLITIFIEEAKVKPRSIRFFRKVMKNMLTVSLTTMKEQIPYLSDMKILPSRNCHMMRLWLDYREREVYPKMSGYAPVAKRRAQSVQAGTMQINYTDLPKKLRFPEYAVSAIPLGALAAVKPGTLPGMICRIPPGFDDTMLVHGIVINSTKADILTNLLRTQELAAIRLDTDSGELLIDMGIDSTYRIWEVPQEDKETILQFERAKRAMSGFHFVAVHNPQFGLQPELPYEDDEGLMDLSKCTIAGLWLCMDYAPRDAQ